MYNETNLIKDLATWLKFQDGKLNQQDRERFLSKNRQPDNDLSVHIHFYNSICRRIGAVAEESFESELHPELLLSVIFGRPVKEYETIRASKACLGDEEISALLAGTLNREQEISLGKHIFSCLSCESEVMDFFEMYHSATTRYILSHHNARQLEEECIVYLIKTAQRAKKEGRLVLASIFGQIVNKKYPKNQIVCTLLSHLYLLLGEYERTIKIIEQMGEKLNNIQNLNSVILINNFGCAYFMKGNKAKATAIFKQLIKDSRRLLISKQLTSIIWQNYAHTLYSRELFGPAVFACEESAKLNSNSLSCWTLLLNCARKTKNLEKMRLARDNIKRIGEKK